MGKHIVIKAATPEALILKLIDTLDQTQLEEAIQLLIDRLDCASDPDEDHCLAGDDRGTSSAFCYPGTVPDRWAGDPADAEEDDSDSCKAGDDRGTPYPYGASPPRRDPPFIWLSRDRLISNPVAHC